MLSFSELKSRCLASLSPYLNRNKFDINDNMPSLYANSLSDSVDPLDVVFVVYPDIVLLDLAGPLQVFTHACVDIKSAPAYRTSIISQSGGRVPTNTIVPVETDPMDGWIAKSKCKPIHTLVLVGGDGAIPAAQNMAFVAMVKDLAGRATRVCSICSGALVLAAAGLLDGKRAVTHWEDCERLERDYPAVKVEQDPIYIQDGNVWTSAGITAGVDMSLAIIEEDLGKQAAINMARSLVIPMARSGGQSQFSPELDRQSRDSKGQFSVLHNWISENIQRKITVEDMADVCGMSSRNFSRRYTEVMGVSPAKSIETIRVNAAREQLEITKRSIKAVAETCGFKDDERLRRAFQRHIKTSPTEYRKQFQVF
jgi:transcriptional regulator GlxA family with amidase domain